LALAAPFRRGAIVAVCQTEGVAAVGIAMWLDEQYGWIVMSS
jgi:hypothetical protein